MPLSRQLDHIMMRFPCARCSEPIEKAGRWFVVAGRFRCAGCGAENRVTYDQKARLQRAYIHLLPKLGWCIALFGFA